VGTNDFQASWKNSATEYRADDHWVMMHDKPKYNYEEIQEKSDGMVVWLRTSKVPLHDREGRVIGVLGCYEDITERKAAEAALHESEERYRCLVELTPDSILIHQNNRIIFHNNAALQLFGAQNSSDLMGKSLLDFIQFKKRSKIKDQMVKLSRWANTLFIMEEPIIRMDSQVRTVELSMTLFVDKSKPAILILLHDVTEKKRLEKEILEIADKEQKRIGQDLHDQLCQYLSGIKFRAILLKQKVEQGSTDAAQEAALIERLLNEANQQARDIARGLVPVEVEASGLMGGLEELARRTAKIFRLSCSCEFKAPILVDNHFIAVHLYRIAQEAVNNSVKHGRSTVISVGLMKTKSQLILTIKDNGVGLPCDLKDTKGMGLGIMKYRARLIGASLSLTRRKKRGTIVTCSLPIPIATNQEEGNEHEKPKP
jgi:PAS domain S-box-containing protein